VEFQRFIFLIRKWLKRSLELEMGFPLNRRI
jgi:hypothetical protein